MEFFEISVTFKEIKEIYDHFRNYFNKGAEVRCMGYQIAYQNIEKWQAKIAEFSKDLADRKVTVGQFFEFTYKPERVPISERSIELLSSDWFNNYNYRKNWRKHSTNLENLSKGIRDNIYYFKEEAVGRKRIWLAEAHGEDFVNVDHTELDYWLNSLDAYRNKVLKLVQKLDEHDSLQCNRFSYGQIFENAINKIRE